MRPPINPKSEDAALEQLWRQVCASRGTPAPDAAQLAGFIEDLGALEREKLESVLLLAARGREPAGELSLLSWAAACTRPALLDQLQPHGLTFTSVSLFACGGGYGWERKLVIQLTPEEMPAVIATLMGLIPSVRFGHHGANRDKFVEVRRQESGLVIVTGDKALSYAVPVPAATAFYVLDLFCRAMAMAAPERSVADVLMLVKSAHGF